RYMNHKVETLASSDRNLEMFRRPLLHKAIIGISTLAITPPVITTHKHLCRIIHHTITSQLLYHRST
ncbi:Hypothetical predicted protein, partial [Paramuricea clavata]